jgi:hypothetical protein
MSIHGLRIQFHGIDAPEGRAIREKAVWMGKDADRQAETVIEELEKSVRGGSGMSIAPKLGY